MLFTIIVSFEVNNISINISSFGGILKDLKIKIKRQTEILGVVIANPGKYSGPDLEVLFGVNEATINRDLNVLRAMGIDIHSERKKGTGTSGIIISQEIPLDVLKSIIPEYVGITINSNSYDKSTNLLIRKLKANAIAVITLLQLCIEKNNLAKIHYNKDGSKKKDERIVEPYCIFQADKNWRLLAKHDGIIKQFMLSKITSVEYLDKKFKPISQKQKEEIFATSFKGWLGSERHKVKLQFSSRWAPVIKQKQMMEFEKIEDLPDGSIIYETVVSSLSEIANWVISWGRGVIVLHPESLKRIVINTAKDVLSNYKL